MYKYCVIVALLICIIANSSVLNTFTYALETNNWPVANGSLNNNRFLPSTSSPLFNNTLEPLWSIDFNRIDKTVNRTIESAAIVQNGNVYVNTSTTIFCLDENNGSVIWKKNTGGNTNTPANSSPTISQDNDLYVCTNNGKLICFSGRDGEMKWSKSVDGDIFTPPTVAGDKVYAITSPFNSNSARSIKCFNRKNGVLVWSVDYGSSFESMAIVNEKLIFGNNEGLVHCIHKDNPNIVFWQYRTDFHINKLVSNGNRLYISSNKLTCLDINSGQMIWQFPEIHKGPFEHVSDPITAKYPIINGNIIYFYLDRLYVLDATSEKKVSVINSFQLKNDNSSEMLLCDNVLYLGCKTLYMLDAMTLATKSQLNISNGFDHCIPTIANNKLFVNTKTGILCFGKKNIKPEIPVSEPVTIGGTTKKVKVRVTLSGAAGYEFVPGSNWIIGINPKMCTTWEPFQSIDLYLTIDPNKMSPSSVPKFEFGKILIRNTNLNTLIIQWIKLPRSIEVKLKLSSKKIIARHLRSPMQFNIAPFIKNNSLFCEMNVLVQHMAIGNPSIYWYKKDNTIFIALRKNRNITQKGDMEYAVFLNSKKESEFRIYTDANKYDLWKFLGKVKNDLSLRIINKVECIGPFGYICQFFNFKYNFDPYLKDICIGYYP